MLQENRKYGLSVDNLHVTASPTSAPGDGYAIMVLLVDDQLMVGEVIRRMLADQDNIDFHYCGSAREALSVAKEVKPTVILQDLVMPGVNGLELVRQYRDDAATSGIPIIVLSNKEEAAIKREAFKAGANDYLVKLPDEIELITRIQYHSRAYLNQLQRDDAYRALRESQHQLMEMNFELQRLTDVDGLTGLSNRRYFDRQIESEWVRALDAQHPVSLFMLDVDHFKSFNDTHGHLAGDVILKRVAETIQRMCGSAECAARFGGDEFAVLLAAKNAAELREQGELLRSEIESLQVAHEGPQGTHYLTASMGGASLVPQPGETFLALIEAADRALYEAKNAGRNRVVVHDGSQN